MMSTTLSRPPEATSSVVGPLLPIVAVVFTAYLIVGLAMPVLPLHVHEGLGLGTFVVGLVAGGQFAASLISRFWAGHHADSRGAKHAVVTGLVVAVLAGLLYWLSLRFAGEPDISVTILQSSVGVDRRQGGARFGLPCQHADRTGRGGYGNATAKRASSTA
jgi:MFS family permease